MIQGDHQHIRAKMERDDLVYQTKGGRDLRIRMVYPDYHHEKKIYPLIMHVQGSAWFEQNLNGQILDFKDIVTSGYVLAIVEYLPLPEATFPSHVEDAKMAIRYLNRHADKLGIDMENTFISGDSSGGHTALMCWATWNTDQLDVSTEPLPPIKGCIDLYGVVDIVSIADAESAIDHTLSDSPEALLIGGKKPIEHVEKAEEASVIHYLDNAKTYPPLLIMHGNKDTVVPFEQSVQLFEYCQSANIDAEMYCVDDADHGGSLFYCDAVIQTMIQFLNRHLED
ncbi:Acetyl esterase/lipase [Pelagirhabdus alkalitolerans]|uniref:Acetyl esterase/lipase n=2 Tax=Pelagirhabdus alkalitolerans TaxID=1612202 RepID=A0A1G6GNF4_9BACI|nr:Acetyl esterase/lipase [Pelagirhabdus alkalitolerans]